MIIISELTGEKYKTVEECQKAEENFLKEKKEQAKAKQAHREALDKAYNEAIEACERYLKLSGVEYEFDDEHNTVKIYKENDKNKLFDIPYWTIF